MKVLVVEDNIDAAQFLSRDLRRYGHDTKIVNTGEEALKQYHRADFVLLDLELPDLDGLEVCRGIRAASDLPIIAVTNRATELDRVLGLQAGSDDYVVKPYGLSELMARIDAVMRRVRPRAVGSEGIARGSLRVEPRTRRVFVGTRPVSLTRKEFDLLYLLAAEPEAVMSRRQIMAKVWDYEYPTASRTIDTHVSSLRNKLGASGWIVTVRGVGFRLGDEHGHRPPTI